MDDKHISFIDYHCHLDLYKDYENKYDECEKEKIYTLAVTTLPKAWSKNKLLARNKKFIRLALGFHPQLVEEYVDDFYIFEKYFHETRFIGEVGIDASKGYYNTLQLQKSIFTKILKMCNNSQNRILSVHSKGATDITLNLIEDNIDTQNNKIVLHWFYGTKKDVNRAIELGCYFSININMLRNPTGRKLITMLPPDRILTETDGPFTNTLQRVAGPMDIKCCIEEIANLFAITNDEMKIIVFNNFSRLENIK